MKSPILKIVSLLVWLAPALFAQDFSIRAIEAAIDDELYPLAEEQIWRALSLDRTIEDKTDLTILLVRSLIGQQRYDDATILADESTHLLKQGAFVFWKAQAFFEAGDTDAGLKTLSRMPKKSEFIPLSLRLRGRIEYANKDLKAAEDAYDRFRKKFKSHEEAEQNLLDLATVQLERKRNDDARKTMQELLDQFPSSQISDSIRLMLARELIAENKRKELPQAAELLRKLGETETATPRLRIAAWLELSQLEKRAGQNVNAADALFRAENLTGESALGARQKAARANLLFAEGNSTNALSLFDEAIRMAPDEELAAEILVHKAETLLQLENYVDAEPAFQACLNVASDIALQARALSGKGWSLWKQGLYEEAAIAFEQAAPKWENLGAKVINRIKAGDARLEEKQFEMAHENYRFVIENSKEKYLTAHATHHSGLALLGIGNTEEARQYFIMTETNFPNSTFAPHAALQQAELLQDAEQWDSALLEYVRIAEQYTNETIRATALHQQGLLQFGFRRLEESLEAFNTVTETYPTAAEAPQAFYMRGFCRYLQGDAKEALSIFNLFIEKYPESPWTPDVLFLVGELAYNRGDYLKARDTFLDIVVRFPKHDLADDSLFWSGNALLRQDSFLEAFSTYTQLAKDYPQSELILKTRFAQGESLTELGEFARAILAYEEVIKAAPDNPLADQARGRLADCLFTLGSSNSNRFLEALEAYQELYKRPSTSFGLKLQALYKIARCEDKIGMEDQAFAHYMEAVYSVGEQADALSPEAEIWFARAAFEAATLQEQKQNWTEAIHIYERIIDAKVPTYDEAKKRIKTIKQEHLASQKDAIVE